MKASTNWRNKMNDKSITVTDREAQKLRIIRTLTAIIATISAISAAVAVLLTREDRSRYWGSTPAVYVFCAATALGVICAVACLFTFRSGTEEKLPTQSSPRRATEVISSFVLLLSAFAAFVSDTSAVLKAVLVISVLVAALIALRGEYNGSVNSALVGTYAKTVFCILTISVLYLDMIVEMNSPFKLIVQFAAAAVALSALCDARRISGGVSARMSVGAKVLVCLLGLSSGAVAIAGAIFKGELIPAQYFIYSAYFTAEAIYALISLFGAEVALSDSI